MGGDSILKHMIFCHDYVGEELGTWLLGDHREKIGRVVVLEVNKVSRLAKKLGIPVSFFIDESQLLEEILVRNELIELGFLLWWPKILSPQLLKLSKCGWINTHPSLLPFNRGKHTSFWALVEAAPFGVTLHFVNQGIDSGAILAQREIKYSWEDTGESIYKRARDATIELFKDCFLDICNFKLLSTPQRNGEGSFHYASEIHSASRINLDKLYRGRDILNLLRARTFAGYPGCWFEDSGDRYEISIKIRKVN